MLEMDREINAETLTSYLPESSSQSLPALFKEQGGQPENFSEREILYKILFDMRRDVTDLKKLVHQLLQQGEVSEDLLEEHSDLFNNMNNELPLSTKHEEAKPYLLAGGMGNSSANTPTPVTHTEKDAYEEAKYEEVSLDDEEESLSLEKKEKEMIIKALRKNNNKRKYAAQDLGISERTLYRKIKQYEIDE